MELWKKQKKIGIAFCIFLSLMFLCTLISRAVYASKLPQITTKKPERTALMHRVEAEGIVQQGMEYAVNALSGLRCRTVHAHIGDRVTTETLLFEIDMEDLEEQIRDQEMTIQKLTLTIQEQEQNKSLAAGEKKTEQNRAKEDYDRAAESAQDNVDRAKEDLKSAQDALENLKQSPAAATPEEEREKAWAEYNVWAAKEQELQGNLKKAQAEKENADKKVKDLEAAGASADSKELEEAKASLEEAKKNLEKAEEEYNNHTSTPVNKPDYSSEDAEKAAWEEKKSSLEGSIGAAERSLSDARKSRDDTLLDAKRRLDDSGKASAADNSLAINRLELSVLKEKLEKYQEVLRTGGRIYPESDGIVTRIQVSPGERIPDGAAIVYADLESPLEFHLTLTKDQKKYVNQGDTATLSLGKSKESVTVDYVAASEASPELFEAIIFLPQGVGTLGQSGLFTTETQTDVFNCCIPLEALYTDQNGRNYIYTLKEKSGILGPELAAEIVYVNVLDQNDKYAAIEEGVIDSETELIVSTTEPLSDRTIVRYKE
ncbi:hypothetical protein [Candidatus Merdisoma sp. JLR.KK006]|uniref:hypothetical protein n=1 Tax=Candidatus Merdisoma sp. JLR.KK006 TaxID=3112626 RepID=UPI002FF3C72B